MKEFENLLFDYSITEKRSALYYLGRYIKQADVLNDYEKDIFDDGYEIVPSEKIKKLTLRLINFIENEAGKKVEDFTNDEFYFWMDTIAEIEDKIDKEPSKEQIQKALKELEKFDLPNKIKDK